MTAKGKSPGRPPGLKSTLDGAAKIRERMKAIGCEDEKALANRVFGGNSAEAIKNLLNPHLNRAASRDVIKNLAKYLNILPTDIVNPNDWDEDSSLQDPEQQGRTIVPHPFQAIIDEKTKDFVGRDYVFNAIAEFIDSNPNGYFTIIGDPGMGKSAILAKYVQNTKCIAHFNVQRQYESAEKFLETLYTELIRRYELPSRSLPADVKQYASSLYELLLEAAQKRNGKPLIIAIDALDEVEEENRRTGFNILYLPIYLPEGVYVVMTKRRGVDEVPFMTYSPKKLLNLLECQNQSRQDVCTYIQNRLERSEGLQKRQAKERNFVNKIADKSHNNFMYLVYVLDDIEKGLFLDLSLDSFPTGLQEYYEFHWQRMGMNKEPLPELRLKVVYYLAAAREPITLVWLDNRLPSESAIEIQKVLSEWKQFLHEEFVGGQRRYSVYHASFRDFLHRQDILDGVEMTIEGVNSQIVDSFTKGLFDDE